MQTGSAGRSGGAMICIFAEIVAILLPSNAEDVPPSFLSRALLIPEEALEQLLHHRANHHTYWKVMQRLMLAENNVAVAHYSA